MKRNLLAVSLLLCFATAMACNKAGQEDDPPAPPEPDPELKYASKPLNQCEILTNDWMHPYTWSKSNLKIQTYGADKKEGKFSYYMNYNFTGSGVNESAYLRHDWDTWRTDLSFEPLGISMWIKGAPTNAGTLRFCLITDSCLTPGVQISREEYEYRNSTVLQCGDWQHILIKYSDLKPTNPSFCALQLDKVIAYRIEFVNTGNVVKNNNYVLIDDIRQETLFDAEAKMNKKARFSSIFIQLVNDYAAKDASSWESSFRDIQSLGINEMIVQYGACQDRCWYAGTNLEWAKKNVNPIVNTMVEGAERCGFKIVFGLYSGGYGEGYPTLTTRNKQVADEIFAKFGSSPCFGGWYIPAEFYDSTWEKNWLRNNTERDALGDFNQAVASYCKSLKNAPVMIAPALWRGMPAKMCGEWYGAVLKRAPDVDIMYLQDCGGRGGLEVTCPTVDLPNWYKYIKEACEDAGVIFGVDLESFALAADGVSSNPREWDYLKYQLYIAGMFTDYITNFSWVSFRPGDKNFEEYRKSLTN